MRDPLVAERAVLSVIGPHAGEDEHAIFSRKISDITIVGRTLWLCQSPAARPDRAQKFFENADAVVMFLAPAKANGVRATTADTAMTEFSSEKSSWQPMPKLLGPVTGQAKSSTYALVISTLTLLENAHVDLWQYADESDDGPIKFRLGASTLLARRQDTSMHASRAKSRMRRIVAVGRLAAPFSAWVR